MLVPEGDWIHVTQAVLILPKYWMLALAAFKYSLKIFSPLSFLEGFKKKQAEKTNSIM